MIAQHIFQQRGLAPEWEGTSLKTRDLVIDADPSAVAEAWLKDRGFDQMTDLLANEGPVELPEHHVVIYRFAGHSWTQVEGYMSVLPDDPKKLSVALQTRAWTKEYCNTSEILSFGLQQCGEIIESVTLIDRALLKQLGMLVYLQQMETEGYVVHEDFAHFRRDNGKTIETMDALFERLQKMPVELDFYLGCYEWDEGKPVHHAKEHFELAFAVASW